MYVDDTVLHVSHESKGKIENDVNQDMQNLLSYFRKNKLAIILKREILKQCYSERLNVWQLQVKLMFCLATRELSFIWISVKTLKNHTNKPVVDYYYLNKWDTI